MIVVGGAGQSSSTQSGRASLSSDRKPSALSLRRRPGPVCWGRNGDLRHRANRPLRDCRTPRGRP